MTPRTTLVALVSSIPLVAQTPEFSLVGKSPNAQYGSSLTSPGDLNGDGYPDLIIGAAIDQRIAEKGGALEVVSGKDRRILYTWLGKGAGDELGFAGAGAGDVNRDGVPDIAVACISGVGADRTFIGHARVYSGKNGERLHVFKGEKDYDFYGLSVSGLGDLDADGHDDIGVGVPGTDRFARNQGALEVRSGKTGELIYRIEGETEHDQYGWFHRPVDDIDRDGIKDFLVGAPGHLHQDADGNPLEPGYAELRSGRNGKLIHRWYGESLGDRMGWNVNRIEDLDGDGLADCMVGAPATDSKAGVDTGSVYLFSSRTGKLLQRIDGKLKDGYFGFCLSSRGDVNGDQFADVWVSSPYADANGEQSGLVSLISGRTGNVLLEIPGRSEMDQAGFNVLTLGDIGDGVHEVVIGARSDDVATGEMIGAANIYRVAQTEDECCVEVLEGSGAVQNWHEYPPVPTEVPETFQQEPKSWSGLAISGSTLALAFGLLLMRKRPF